MRSARVSRPTPAKPSRQARCLRGTTQATSQSNLSSSARPAANSAKTSLPLSRAHLGLGKGIPTVGGPPTQTRGSSQAGAFLGCLICSKRAGSSAGFNPDLTKTLVSCFRPKLDHPEALRSVPLMVYDEDLPLAQALIATRESAQFTHRIPKIPLPLMRSWTPKTISNNSWRLTYFSSWYL